MDLTTTTAPDSSQVNADDFISGPRTFTITDVTAGSAEQPVNVALEGTDRFYRPSKSMRRVLVSAWGSDGDTYRGRRIELYRDPEVKFGRDVTGGIKISRLSHIERPLVLALTTTRGKRAPHTVQPLADAPAPAPAPDNGAGALGPAFTEAGILTADRLAWVCKVIGRDVTSPAQLTTDEVQQVLASLTDDASGEEWPDVAEPGNGAPE